MQAVASAGFQTQRAWAMDALLDFDAADGSGWRAWPEVPLFCVAHSQHPARTCGRILEAAARQVDDAA